MSHNGKINVLQVIEGLSWGGAESKLLELIACMDSDRFSTTVCSLGMGERIRDRFDQLGVKFVPLTRRRRIDPKLIWDVAKLVRQEKIDVVMTTLFYADVVGYSRLTGLDEEKTHQKLAAGLNLLNEVIRIHRGQKVHEAGVTANDVKITSACRGD